MTQPVLRPVLKRHSADCGVAVLATYCGVSYEESLLAIGSLRPDVLNDGVWTGQLPKAAKKLGMRLRWRTKFDLESDEGILHVSSAAWPMSHLVVLKRGLLFDPDDGCVWEHEDFAAHHKATFKQLLTTVD